MYIAANQGEIAAFADMSQLVNTGFVASSPGSAVDLIAKHFGKIPDRLGSNCRGLTQIRDAVARMAGSSGTQRIANALILVAPHTHWRPAPIIYTSSASEDRYCVGPQTGQPPFIATSFVFSRSGPVPYEWSDASCRLDLGEVAEVHRLIETLNDNVSRSPWFFEPFPIGLSVNHRFKSIFEFPLTSTHESPEDDEWDVPEALAYITRSYTSEDLARVLDDQVGWTAHHPPQIDQDDLEKFKVLEQVLAASGADILGHMEEPNP